MIDQFVVVTMLAGMLLAVSLIVCGAVLEFRSPRMRRTMQRHRRYQHSIRCRR